MTDVMNLRALVEKTPDTDLLCEMIGFAAERLMEMEVDAATGAGYGEKLSFGRLSTTATGAGIGRHVRAPSTHPEAQEGLLFPGLSGATPHGGEGFDGVIQEVYVQTSRHARSAIWSRPWAWAASQRASLPAGRPKA